MFDARELSAGVAAGSVGQTVGHPFDTIKVRLQTDGGGQGGMRYASGRHCAALSLRREGARVFFRGLSVPLAAKGVEQSVSFGVRGAASRSLKPYVGDRLRAWASGACAGAVNALVMTPVWLLKVQLQVTASGGLRGPMDALTRTVARQGVRGLYTGGGSILGACVVGASTRFATYDAAVARMRDRGLRDPLAAACGGGVAGMASWMAQFPLDLISARTQAATVAPAAPRGAVAHARDVLRRSGVAGFYRGLGPCLARAFPVNAAVFLTYEVSMRALNDPPWRAVDQHARQAAQHLPVPFPPYPQQPSLSPAPM
eukprot:TRINITY_DN12751_c0_g2_i1.p1 TRINITY_DN12751_c0_g2~~TRINITY_DN12751_c0_g2_i1.p1  ORF type:complete len:314 (+),score=24.38 TRINITY_DN12751_c0_g2_i1:57-998(+)